MVVRGSGLRMTALPSASAGATDRMDRMPGKLNGEITPTTPTGTRRATDRRGLTERSISPYGWEASAADSCSSVVTRPTSKAALPCPEPASATSQRARRSGFSWSSWAALSRTAARLS